MRYSMLTSLDNVIVNNCFQKKIAIKIIMQDLEWGKAF